MPGGALGEDADEESGETATSQVASSPSGGVDLTGPLPGPEPPPTDPDLTDPDQTLKPVMPPPVIKRQSVRLESVPRISPDETLRNKVPDDEEETRLDPRSQLLIRDEDATRRDPFAQAVALDELRKSGLHGPIVTRYTPAGADPKSKSAIKVRPPSAVPTDDGEEGTHSMALDSAKLFAGVDPRKVGGTALLAVLPESQQYSALPRDVSVYIKEDSLENFASDAPRKESGVVRRWLLGIVLTAIAVGCVYVLTRT